MAFAPGANAQESALIGKTVVLDPGHGGSDSGAVNGTYKLKEKDQNLEVAKRLQALLEASGATVNMTRTADVYLSNRDRYTFLNPFPARTFWSRST